MEKEEKRVLILVRPSSYTHGAARQRRIIFKTSITANSRHDRRTVTSASSRLRRSRKDHETEGFTKEISRQNTKDISVHDVTDDELREKRRQKLDRPKVMQKMYEKACNKNKVVPVRQFWETPDNVDVSLPNYNLGSLGVSALAVPLMLHESITRLDLSGNVMGVIGIESLVEALRDNTTLNYLNLSENKLKTDGAAALKEFLREHPALQTLCVSGNGFKDDDSIMFAQVMKENQRLKHVDFSHNEFSETAGMQFRYVLSDTDNLETFNISWNHLRRRGAMDLLAGVKKNYGLRVLDISFNGFASEGAAVMANVLKKNRTLQEVDMRHNRLNDADVINIASKMDGNDSLKVLKLGDNHFTQAGALALLTVLLNPDNVVALELLDLGNTSVDETFDFIVNELKTSRQNLTIKYGKVMTMKKRVINSQASTSKTPDDKNVENIQENVERAQTMPNITTTEGTNVEDTDNTSAIEQIPNTEETDTTSSIEQIPNKKETAVIHYKNSENDTNLDQPNTEISNENKNMWIPDLQQQKAESDIIDIKPRNPDLLQAEDYQKLDSTRLKHKDDNISTSEKDISKVEIKSKTDVSKNLNADPRNLFVLQRETFIEKKS